MTTPYPAISAYGFTVGNHVVVTASPYGHFPVGSPGVVTGFTGPNLIDVAVLDPYSGQSITVFFAPTQIQVIL